MLRNVVLFTFLLALTSEVQAAPPPAEHKILKQDNAPLVIEKYSARYQASLRSSYSREGIRHILEYRNITDKKIVAAQFGLLAFNIFNEFQDRLGGYTIENITPQELVSGEWLASALAESAFYTGVAYISKVRFEDGEIWTADLDDVTSQVQEIEASFSADSLTE